MKSDKLDTGFLSSDSLCCETELLMLQHVQYTPSHLTENSDNAFSEDFHKPPKIFLVLVCLYCKVRGAGLQVQERNLWEN